MKHKKYEKWVLDDASISPQQREDLNRHLQSCRSCHNLQTGWNASKQLIANAVYQKPASGFSQRWQQTVIRKKQTEKIRRYRLSMFFLIVLAFSGAVLYLITSGTAMQSFANSITMLTNFTIKITNGLSMIGYWIQTVPIAIPLTMGFFIFGLFSAFMMAGVFFLWNLRRRELVPNEIQIE